MTSEGLRFKYLDASALVKLYIEKEEKGIQHLREFFYSNINFYTTWLCLAEALGVLKRKWDRKNIETEEYIEVVCSLLFEWRNRIESDDIKSVDSSVRSQSKRNGRKI